MIKYKTFVPGKNEFVSVQKLESKLEESLEKPPGSGAKVGKSYQIL